MRITDLPPELRPRERLLDKGANILSDAELLAILLRIGSSGQSAVDLGESLLRRFGSLGQLLSAGPSELRRLRGLGDAKCAVLLAVNELHRRSLEGILRETTLFDSPLAVCRYLKHRFSGLAVERFIGLFVDMQNRLICCEDLATGTLDRVQVYPREIARRALAHNAAGVIFAHNHPGGRAQPSGLDKALTAKLKQVMECIEVNMLDHLIVSDNEIWSFRQHGLC
jgi:DNA repair protein RadC